MEIFYIFDFVFFMIFVCVCVWGGNSYFFFYIGKWKTSVIWKKSDNKAKLSEIEIS